MKDKIYNKEASEMMLRCKNEILSLRTTINALRPKAEAYDNLAILLNLFPKQSMSFGEDLVWILDRRMRELKEEESSDAS